MRVISVGRDDMGVRNRVEWTVNLGKGWKEVAKD